MSHTEIAARTAPCNYVFPRTQPQGATVPASGYVETSPRPPPLPFLTLSARCRSAKNQTCQDDDCEMSGGVHFSYPASRRQLARSGCLTQTPLTHLRPFDPTCSTFRWLAPDKSVRRLGSKKNSSTCGAAITLSSGAARVHPTKSREIKEGFSRISVCVRGGQS